MKPPTVVLFLSDALIPAEAKTVQGSAGKHQASTSREAKIPAVHQDGIARTHLDADIHTASILSRGYRSQYSGKADVIRG